MFGLPLASLQANDPLIRQLYIQNKNLGEHPQILADFLKAVELSTNLTVLDLESNRLGACTGSEQICTMIRNNKSLKILYLSENYFPLEIKANLVESLQHNFLLTTFSIADSTEDNRSYIKISTQKLEKKISSILSQNEMLTKCLAGKSSKVTIAKRNLVTFPKIVFSINKVKEIQSLDLSGNKLTNIPPALWKFEQLHFLDLSDNLLCSITGFEEHTLLNLTHLDLSNNVLTSLPFSFASLRLSFLDLSYNLLVSSSYYPFCYLTKFGAIQAISSKLNAKPFVELPFIRLLFLGTKLNGEKRPEIHLRNYHMRQEAYKSLTNEERRTVSDLVAASSEFLSSSHCTFIIQSHTKSLSLTGVHGSKRASQLTRKRSQFFSKTLRNSSFPTDVERFSEDMVHLHSLSLQPSQVALGHKLVLSRTNRFPVFVEFHLSTDTVETLDYLVPLIYSLSSLGESKNQFPVFLLGEYHKSSVSAKQKGKSRMKFITQRIVQLFPWLIICSCSVQESGQNIKNLSAVLTKELRNLSNFYLPTWTSPLGNDYHRFIDHVRFIKETSGKARNYVMMWCEFTTLAASFGIPSDMYDDVSIFLRDQGDIQHFRDTFPENDHPARDLLFFHPEYLLELCSILICSYRYFTCSINNSSKLVVLRTSSTKMIWKDLSIDFRTCILDILRQTGIIYFLNKEAFVIPSQFPPQPKGRAHEKNKSISRCFCFTQMSEYNFAALLCFLHNLVCTDSFPEFSLCIKNIYRYEVIIQEKRKGTEASCTINYDFVRSCVVVHSAQSSSVEQSHSVLSCVKKESPKTFSMEEIESLASKGVSFILCNETPVRVDAIAPDITLDELVHFMVEYESINIFEKVGEGGYSSVYRASLTDGEKAGQCIALKKIEQEQDSPSIITDFKREIMVMAGLQHPNIIALIGICKHPFAVLTEFCPYGDLFTYIQYRKKMDVALPNAYVLSVLKDIARGMLFLHSTAPPTLHRDLKSPNILLCKVSPDESNLTESKYSIATASASLSQTVESTIKIADFGVSIRAHENAMVTERVVANPIWLAPELLSNQACSYASDVYAFAMIAFELFSLEFPFAEFACEFGYEIEALIMEGKRPTIPVGVAPFLKQLISQCWAPEPKERPTFRYILKKLERCNSIRGK